MIPRRAWFLMALAMVVAAVLHGGYDAPHGLALSVGAAAGASIGLGCELARGWLTTRER